MANRMAIHHPRALGAHHVEPTAGFWCLRWWRDSHRTITPSGRTRSTNVAGAPTRRMAIGTVVLSHQGRDTDLTARGRGRPMSTFPPIADYGLLSNCEQSCLVAPNGAVEWLCLPRPDSPSVFGALLDRAAGTFRFGPSNAQVPQQRRY